MRSQFLDLYDSFNLKHLSHSIIKAYSSIDIKMDNFLPIFTVECEFSYLLLYNGTLTIIRGAIVVAKSKAKKVREKLTREGRMNPEEKRSPFVFADMRPRTTKTKKDHLYQFKYKNHQSQTGNDGSFYLLPAQIVVLMTGSSFYISFYLR